MWASAVGNILEWFDFGVFAFLSPQIGALFFPSDDPLVSTLNAYVVFGGGFIVRPLGGVLLVSCMSNLSSCLQQRVHAPTDTRLTDT